MKVNNISLKQEGGQMTEQVEAQPQQQSVDPAVQQISDFISQAIEQGENPAEVVMTLVEQQVEQEIIGQALMMNGFEENDILSLFQQISQGQEEVSNEPGSPDDLNSNPQEISRNQSLEEEMQDPEMEMAKSGIEIKPENEGKFTRWAEARGMSAQEAASKVMANTNEYPPAIVKMANFAKNAAGWNKQDGGEQTSEMKAYLEALEFNKRARQAIGTNDIEKLKQLRLDKPYNNNDLARDFAKLQQLRKAAGLGTLEEASILFPHVGQQIRGGFNSMFGTNFKEGGEQYDMGGTPQGKVGAVNNAYVKKQNNWQRAPLYINPMEFEYTNDNFSLGKAAAVAYGGYKEFLSGDDTDKDGVKDGFFRDGSKKAGIRDATKGNYYNYEITQDANDTNKYVADNTDLFNASKNKGNLRTVDQYGKDIASNSRFNYDTKIHDYNFITSSRPIDERIYDSAGQKNAIAGKDYNYLASMDKDTRDMIMSGKDDPAGVRMGIDEKGNGMSYMPGADNPYEYNTYMGINKVAQNTMIPTGNNGQPIAGMTNTQPSVLAVAPSTTPPNVPQKSFKDWYATGDVVRNQGKSQEQLKSEYDSYLIQGFKYGGDLDKAQFGPPEWLAGLANQNSFYDPMQQQGINSFFSNMGQTDYMADTQAVADAQLQKQNPALGATPQQQQMQNMFTPQQGSPTFNAPTKPAAPTFEPPKVESTKKFEGGMNRLADSPVVQGYGKLSNFAVKGADVINDWFRDKNVNQAREDNFNKLGADYQYATAEDPFNKRGMWDVNTGTAGSEGDRTTGLYMSKYGGENNTINVDSNLLAKLIAAGADIEIL